MISNQRKGMKVVAIDNEFLELVDDFKKSLEKQLNRTVSYPFATSILKNVFPKNIKVKKVLVKDKSRVNRTVQFTIEYLLEEL